MPGDCPRRGHLYRPEQHSAVRAITSFALSRAISLCTKSRMAWAVKSPAGSRKNNTAGASTLIFWKRISKPNTKLVIVNFPHNPTGSYPSMKITKRSLTWRAKMISTCFRMRCIAFWNMTLRSNCRRPVRSIEKAVSLFGMSKTFGMAGARIGWLVTKDRPLSENGSLQGLYDYLRQRAQRDFVDYCSAIQRGHHRQAFDPHKKKPGFAGRLLCGIWRSVCVSQAASRHDCFSKTKRGDACLNSASEVVQKAEIMLLPSTVFDYGDQPLQVGLRPRKYAQSNGNFYRLYQEIY